MSEQITPHQLGDHVGREVEVTLRGTIDEMAHVLSGAVGISDYFIKEANATITLLPPPVPDEPPAGAVVRKVATGEVGYRDDSDSQPWFVSEADGRYVGSFDWENWIDPGDPIQIAEWVKP